MSTADDIKRLVDDLIRVAIGISHGRRSIGEGLEAQRPLFAAIDALASERDTAVKALNTIHSWLVCAAIASPEDMAQSFPEMCKIAGDVLEKAK